MRSATEPSVLPLGGAAFSLTGVTAFIGRLAIDLATLIGAYLVALYLRRSLPFGRTIHLIYDWHHLRPFVILCAGTLVAHAGQVVVTSLRRDGSRLDRWTSLGSLAISLVGLIAFDPNQSTLQQVYYLGCGLLFIALISSQAPGPNEEDQHFPREALVRLWLNRSLLRIWVLYNVRSRYAQAFLGVAWIVLIPLTTALVISVVFSELMRVHLHNVPFIAFFLAGFVPWGLFNQSIGAGMRSILSAMGLINQIYFPREIIVLSALGEALLDTLFMFVSMLIIDAIVGVYPSAMYILLPLILLIEVVLSLGLMFMLSWLSVLVRDIPQLVSVLLQVLFYLSAVIYPLDIVPSQYRFLIMINPMGVIVIAAQQIIVYQRSPDWLSLSYPAALGAALLVFGYRLFKRNEDRMADMI